MVQIDVNIDIHHVCNGHFALIYQDTNVYINSRLIAHILLVHELHHITVISLRICLILYQYGQKVMLRFIKTSRARDCQYNRKTTT